jgi:hypothetical protein
MLDSGERLVHRVAGKLGISRASGELDVWGLMFNSPHVQWVTVRDLAHDLTYFGSVEAFSDTYDQAELLLRDVEIFRSTTGDKLYRASRVYLARPVATLAIEPLSDETRPIGSGAKHVALGGREILEGRSEHAADDATSQFRAGTARQSHANRRCEQPGIAREQFS